MTPLLAAIEAGGTKFICGLGTGPADLQTVEIPTTTPDETRQRVLAYFADKPIAALGIGSFGPVDLNKDSSSYGCITTTPKAGWQQVDLARYFAAALQIPVAIDTDVNAAALAEREWGAAHGLDDFVYFTVGTGIGGGGLSGGRLIHGLLHPEMGHIRVSRDPIRDPFPGNCPFHGGDCLEGLASGPAMAARWKQPAFALPPDHPAWALEAHYLAQGLASCLCVLSPRRILLGGGVMIGQPQLFPLLRAEVQRLLNGYFQVDELQSGIDDYIVPPALGSRVGVLGALLLAAQAHALS